MIENIKKVKIKTSKIILKIEIFKNLDMNNKTKDLYIFRMSLDYIYQ